MMSKVRQAAQMLTVLDVDTWWGIRYVLFLSLGLLNTPSLPLTRRKAETGPQLLQVIFLQQGRALEKGLDRQSTA